MERKESLRWSTSPFWACTKGLDWIAAAFVHECDGPEEIRQKAFLAKPMVILCIVAIMLFIGQRTFYSSTADTDSDRVRLFLRCREGLNVTIIVIAMTILLALYKLGMRTALKVFCVSITFLWIIGASVIMPSIPTQTAMILVLDACIVLKSDKDQRLCNWLAGLVLASYTVFVGAEVVAREYDFSIHPFEEEERSVEFPGPLVWILQVVPIFLNFLLTFEYANDARHEAHKLNKSIELASTIAQKLANYDLDAAQDLLSEAALMDAASLRMHAPLWHVLKNLRTYRAFLPDSLFSQRKCKETMKNVKPPNKVLGDAMSGKDTFWPDAHTCVNMLREPDYSLHAFKEDLESAFPELSLYEEGAGESISGLTNHQELQRTMGALYSVYSVARLDLDGKEVFSFGVDSDGKPRSEPVGDGASRKRDFYDNMPWGALLELFTRAELLSTDDHGSIELNKERMMGFMYLTVVHDVMKNAALLPTVQPQHSPYHGVFEGNQIEDHDKAIAYVMDKFPWLLPTFSGLAPHQRAPIIFTQSTMGFNNGWLVQGEAPPGLLFTNFRQVITEGRASEADVSFYFAHWLTDLAGAELFPNDEEWPGAEKFTLKFPQRVLLAFLDSFAFVDHLASSCEVEVMQRYLDSRWSMLGPPSQSVPAGSEVACQRLALMAQGFEAEAVTAFLGLPERDRQTLTEELARTGCVMQYNKAPAALRSGPEGPAICVYYAPALLQKAGAGSIDVALQLLAAVFRAARAMFPLSDDAGCVESTVVVRIDRLKVLLPSQILQQAPWHLQRAGRADAVAAREEPDEEVFRSRTIVTLTSSTAVRRVPIQMPEASGKRRRTEFL